MFTVKGNILQWLSWLTLYFRSQVDVQLAEWVRTVMLRDQRPVPTVMLGPSAQKLVSRLWFSLFVICNKINSNIQFRGQ